MKEPKYTGMKHGKITYEEDGKTFQVPDSAKVSMNFWCFDPSVFPFIQKIFLEFLAEKRAGIPSLNFLYPSSEIVLFLREGVRSKLFPLLPAGLGLRIRKMHLRFSKA